MTFWKNKTLQNWLKVCHMGTAMLDGVAAILTGSSDFEP